jgi:hypothetical protein
LLSPVHHRVGCSAPYLADAPRFRKDARFGGVIMNKSALATAGFGGAAGIVLFIVVEPLLAPDGAKSHHKISGERHRLVKT